MGGHGLGPRGYGLKTIGQGFLCLWSCGGWSALFKAHSAQHKGEKAGSGHFISVKVFLDVFVFVCFDFHNVYLLWSMDGCSSYDAVLS